MKDFDARERAAEAVFAHGLEEQFRARMTRVKALAAWASRTIGASPEDTVNYQDVLYRIAVATADDRLLVERVRDDLAAAGTSTTVQHVGDVLAHSEIEC